jgi:hypothetical protein
MHGGTSAAVFPVSDGKEPLRTHATMTANMQTIERHRRLGLEEKPREIYIKTGAKGACAWNQLSYVRFPWFRSIDWMHLIAGFFGKHICPLLSGDRTPGVRRSPRERHGWDEDFGN